MISDFFKSSLELILYLVAAFLITIIIIYIVTKSIKMYSLKFSANAIQKGEIIKQKMFITKDQYELKINQKLIVDSEYLILGIHDFKTNKSEFASFAKYLDANTRHSYVFYDQRGVGANQPFTPGNQATLLADLDEILTELKEKYEKKIVIVASGKSALGALYYSTDTRVEKFIVLNPTLNPPYPHSARTKQLIFWSRLFLLNTTIVEKYSGFDFTDDKVIAKTLDKLHEEQGQYSFKEYLQNNRMKARVYHNLNVASVPVVWFVSNNDFYCNQKQAVKLSVKVKNELFSTVAVPDFKHFWHWAENEKNFTKIMENL
ncbi:hypothetical protein SCLARK_00584 [Spiroplasma clarkii]|uniref:Serine aminopeptidase S33 domain-containing protein n=1 Tax=Spiroplasma clarkii TaxID=2139 RepID=A0A1Y0L0M6_9MOLU|nr:alpha/beta hydrolase [Spiroplasma clarkii]ARU91259.1 hypothetical protein SCLARK_00584 [Spiroplasma clarkii]ATX70695.1 hypothetical protein SCLAR_v1c03650 [Spiroplasma clarkii]